MDYVLILILHSKFLEKKTVAVFFNIVKLWAGLRKLSAFLKGAVS
jgi:hypothetical protein